MYELQKIDQSLVTAHNNNNGKVVSTFPLPKIGGTAWQIEQL